MPSLYAHFDEKSKAFFTNKVYVALTFAFLLTYIVAVVIGTSLLWFISATIVSVVIVERTLARLALRSLTCAREVAPVGTEDGRVRWTARVTNQGRLPRLFITLRDTLPTWVQLTENSGQHVIQLIWGGQTVELQGGLELYKRGKYRLGPVMLDAYDPLGIFNNTRAHEAEAELTVLPRRLKVETLGFAGGGELGTHHLQRAAVTTDASEFHGVRDYRPGDPLRHIHWKATAHAGDFRVIEFEETLSSDMTILLDLQEGSEVGEGKETTLEYAVVLAASLAEYLVRQGNAVQLALHDGKQVQSVAAHGERSLYRLLDALAGAEARSPLSLAQLVEAAEPWIRNESSVLVLSAAPMDNLAQAAETLIKRCRARVGFLALDAESFKPHPGTSDHASIYSTLLALGAAGRVVRRGDDLRRVLEAG
jgi:uncharacterized protein (DUF58 family)